MTQVYKRDQKGQFAKVNSLLKKIAMAKAQGIPYVSPGKTSKIPPSFPALKNPAAKKLGYDLYERKKAGEFSNDHAIYLAAAKLAGQYKKNHPSASTGMSANQIVNAYKRHEYEEVGFVTLLGQISGNVNQIKRDGPGSDWTPSGKPSAPSKPTIDKTKTGLNITSDKFAKPDTLKPTGKTLGGVTGAKVYTDGKGQQWVVKTPKSGSNAYGNKSFMVDVEIAASRIQNKAGLPVPAMHEEEVDGKHSAVSKMYVGPNGGPVSEAFPKGAGLDISTMSKEDLLALQQNQIIDWLMSNHDSHSGNFLRTNDGIVGIDKGQSFKFFGSDKLSYTYQPVTPLDGNVSVYQRIWKQFAQGKGELFDPNGPELMGVIKRIQSIPDEDLRKLLRPYAIKAAESGSLSMPNKPSGASKAQLVNHFLDEVVKRKNNLDKDFGDYYALVKSEHDKNKPKPKQDPPASSKAKAVAGQGVTVADLENSKLYNKTGLIFKNLQVGDFVVDDHSGQFAPEYFEVTAHNGFGTATLTPVAGGVGFDIDSNDWSDANYKWMEPTAAAIINQEVKKAKAGAGQPVSGSGVGKKTNDISGMTPKEKFDKGILNFQEYKEALDIWFPEGALDNSKMQKLVNEAEQFELVDSDFKNLSTGDIIFDNSEGEGLFYIVKDKTPSVIHITAQKQPSWDVDDQLAPILKSEWEEDGGSSFKVVLQTAPQSNAPELNKPLKSVAGLKAGDKIQAPWGNVFTVTSVGDGGVNGPFFETTNKDGGYGGNIYESTITEALEPGWVFVGNINDQSSVDNNDLAGQPISDAWSLIPGDKITYKGKGWKQSQVLEVTKVVPGSLTVEAWVYAKKDTGAIIKISQEKFKNGEVKFAYAGGKPSRTEDFTPVIGGQPTYLDIGQEVLIKSDGKITKLNISNIEEDNGNVVSIFVTSEDGDEEWEYVPVKGNDGKIHWVDDPSEFLNNTPENYSEIGLPSGTSKPGKVPGELLKDISDVEFGDIIKVGSDEWKVTTSNTKGFTSFAVQKMPNGPTGIVTSGDISSGLVTWGNQPAKKKLKLQGELAKDIGAVEVGDVIEVESNQWKVTKAQYNGVEVINMTDGLQGVVTPDDFSTGKVTWGNQSQQSSSASYPSYPAGDLMMGPFTNQNAPGTTLKQLSLPGWGAYTGQLEVGDEVVAFGANGEFKKGSVVQKAWGPMNCYIAWEDDPTGDWLEFTKGSNGGMWGDGNINGVDNYTLVGKVQNATVTSNPAPQKPMGPSQAPQAAATPLVVSKSDGKQATFDALEVGMIYHIPGGKMQKVVTKDKDSFTAQSISGNTHDYPKEKFNKWASEKGVLLGAPGGSDQSPPIGEVAVDEIYVVSSDPFAPNVTQDKYIVKSKTKDSIELVNLATSQSIKIGTSDWDFITKGWKRVPGVSDWEKYSQGLITWEEYQETSLHKEVVELHMPQGPAALGKPSPADSFVAKKRAEKKPPPAWSAIGGDPVIVRGLGFQIWEMKKNGDFAGDEMMLWKACEKVRRAYVKANPGATDVPSKNQIRHAARRFEYEETGAVIWETPEQQTAQVVGNIETSKGAVNHVPTGKWTDGQSSNKVPLTSFGDSKKLAGSYQNPIHFGYHYDQGVWAKLKKFGSSMTSQIWSKFTLGEKKSVKNYTGGGYTPINGFLRSGTQYGSGAGYASDVKNIDSAMSKSNPAEDWFLVCRGAGGGYDFGLNSHNFSLEEARVQIGKTVLNKGFTSGSLGSQPGYGGKYCRVIYRVPPGLKGLWVSGDGSGNSLANGGESEREYILPRNLKVKVLAVDEHKDGMSFKYDVVVEIVGWEGQGQ